MSLRFGCDALRGLCAPFHVHRVLSGTKAACRGVAVTNLSHSCKTPKACHAGLDPASTWARQHGLRVKPAMTGPRLLLSQRVAHRNAAAGELVQVRAAAVFTVERGHFIAGGGELGHHLGPALGALE